MARVLITHPYHLARDPREANLVRPYAPLGTLVCAAVAQEAGHQVVFHDAMFAPDPSGFGAVLDQHIADGGLDRVAVVADDHAVSVKQCLSRVREDTLHMVRAAQARGIPVFVSGPDVSDHPGVFLEGGATAAASGEPVRALTEWLDGQRDIVGVHGDGGAGGRRGVEDDLDALPDPAWELVDLPAYAQRWRAKHGTWEINIWTARGCPYRCNWCAKPVWGRSYHVRSAERVAAEIRHLRTAFSPDRIWFTDDIFALRPAWLRRFREVLDQPIPYRALCRADLLKEPAYVADLAATGCDEIWIGAESGSDRVLAAMSKDGTVWEVERATELCRQAGIAICYFLQLGYPGETAAEVAQTVEMVRRLKPDRIGVSVSKPMPGTAFFDHVQASMSGANWAGSMDNQTLFEAPFGDAFYAAAKEVIRSTHSASRGGFALRDFVQAPGPQTARRVVGAAFHRVRLPLMQRRMDRLAIPNAQAVPLDW